MPKNQQTMSWLQLRSLCEAWEWVDPRTKIRTSGFNPPEAAKKTARRKAFFIRFITGKGVVESGYCTCIRVDLKRKQRRVRFEQSGEIRWVRDYLIIEVNGIRIVTH